MSRLFRFIHAASLAHLSLTTVFNADVTSGPQAPAPGNSNVDLASVGEVTPEQIASWTAAFEAETRRSKLVTSVSSGELNVSLEEFCQLFINDGAPHGMDKYVTSYHSRIAASITPTVL